MHLLLRRRLPVHFRFDFTKTLQAAAVLLDTDNGQMGYMRLLKLLYIADRELLAETGRPLTGDRVIAMKHGPVLSRVFDLIKGQTAQADEWSNYLHTEGYKVLLKQKPGRGKLSKREVQKLNCLSERFRQLEDFELSDLTHQFPEWQGHYHEGTALPIPWEDVLRAQNKAEMIPIAEREATVGEVLDHYFGS
jgi:uncharacterized phage-associated protein